MTYGTKYTKIISVALCLQTDRTIALASAMKGHGSMALATSFYSVTYNDNTLKSNGLPESSNVQYPITTLTSANVAATEVLLTNLIGAVSDVVLGVTAKTELIWERTLVSSDRASSTSAQRENKLLLRYHDNTTAKKFQLSIPTFDLSKLPDGSEFLALGSGVGAALKTAFEAVVVSPDDDSHTVTLDSAQFVGRNS